MHHVLSLIVTMPENKIVNVCVTVETPTQGNQLLIGETLIGVSTIGIIDFHWPRLGNIIHYVVMTFLCQKYNMLILKVCRGFC